MSGIWISAVPEIRLNTEHVLKGKTPRSRKTALCDVKNTLLNKASSTSNEPLRKVECGQATKSNISSKIPVKEFVKKTPAQSVLKQEGTFTIAQESGCWNGSCDHSEDDIFELRHVSDQLRHEDIKYTSKGLLTLPLLEKEHLDIDIMKENLEILPSWSKNVSAFDSMMIY